jgi:hypothetical protein
MKTTLETFVGFAPNSRTWVYQASRNLTDAEAAEVKQLASVFAAEWKSHGAPLKAAADVLYNRFLVIMVDEDAGSASGCSIDSSVAQIRSIEQKLNIDLLDRMNLAFLNEAGQLETVHANRVSAAFENGILNEQTTVFNNMVTSYSELRTNWRIPLVNSWAMVRVTVSR